MELVPFGYNIDEELNEEYQFIFKSDTLKSDILTDGHYTKIVIDGMNDDLIIFIDCSCKGFKYRQECKHIKESLRILNEWGVNYRENGEFQEISQD